MMKTENSANDANYYKYREATYGVVILIMTGMAALLILVVKLHYMM